MSKKEKFVLVDGNSLINRAFYALPSLKSLSGKPCGAIYGFTNMILNVLLNEKPKYFVCVFDAGKHTFRHDMYPEYKGKRDHMPEDLHEQLLGLKELLKSMGIKVVEIPEIEADDIVGSFTRQFDAEFIVLSGDKDLFQLVDKNTTVWHTKRGITDVVKLDEPTLETEFGLKPYQVIELKSIMGDSSDNIPGVPGIGKVGATKLIQDYDNLDNVYAHIDQIKGSVQTKLIENKELAYLSKKLATIKLDVPLDCSLEDCELHLPFGAETYHLMEDYGFKSILKRKEFFNPEAKQQITAEQVVEVEKIEIDSQEKFDQMMSCLSKRFAFYYENMFLHLSNGEKEFILFETGEIFAKNIDKLRNLFVGEMQKVCFDAKDAMHYLSRFEIDLCSYFDVSLSIYVANELDAEITFKDALKLNGISTECFATSLLKLKEIYMQKLIQNMQLKLFSEIELPLVKVLFNMEEDGIKIDVEQIKSLSLSYHQESDNLEKIICEQAGESFNLNSPKQLQVVLFEKLGLKYSGKQSTSIEVLNELIDQHPIIQNIIRYRKINKLCATYLDGMLNFVSADGKIHTTYMQRTTSTGRLSSREPNLQNLPIRDDEGKALRKMFSSAFDGGTIISADYNQIELRLIANFSGDQNMISDYLSGKDIHSATASKIFEKPIEEITPNERRVAKSVNFGIIYGISAFGLSQNIHTSTKEAAAFIKKYMEIYPRVKEYGEECVLKARELGYASTMMGRIRHISDINSSNHVMRGFAERVAKNMPLQGSASDIIKIAMINVFNTFKEKKLKSKLILQIHDELVVDCFPGESQKVKDILKQVMENVVHLTVPLLVEVSEGKTLFDAK